MFTLSMFLSLIAGISLFLFGMKMMSDGMERAAGARLRKILEMLTKNRFIGVLVGIGFTMLIQSSSATTVMVVSFVNAGLLSLSQATGVILGANIGTTITAQLIAFNLTKIAPFFLLVGVIMVMFIKKDSVQRIGAVIMGFGVLFFGMFVMSEALEPLKTNPAIQNLLIAFDNPLMAMLVGIAVTCLVHSSSAAVGILQVLALQLNVPLEMSVYIVLGCNIGTCVDALLAGLAGNKNAKRAAFIHLFFNVFGSALMFLLLHLTPLISWIKAFSGMIAPEGNAALEIANAHTMFKVIEVVIFFPLAPYLVKFVQFIIPGVDREAEEMRLQYLGDTVMMTPPAAVHSAVLEAERMARLAADNLVLSMEAFETGDSNKIDLVNNREKAINYLNHTITDYLVKINQLDISPEDAALIGSLFHVVNDVERIGDHAENMAEFAVQRVEGNLVFSEQAQREIHEMVENVSSLLNKSIELMSTQDESKLPEVRALEEAIDEMEEDFQQAHVDRLARGECSALTGMVYADILSNLERVADHAMNVAFLMAEKKTHRQKTLASAMED